MGRQIEQEGLAEGGPGRKGVRNVERQGAMAKKTKASRRVKTLASKSLSAKKAKGVRSGGRRPFEK